MARAKTKDAATPAEGSNQPFEAFDTLMATAAVDSQIGALVDSGADQQTVDTALTESLRAAQERWGLGLHHLTHEARLEKGEDWSDIALLVDGRPVVRISEGYANIAAAYEPMRATDERGLSLWGALPEGHRVSADLPGGHLKILIEEARDFETHWMPGRAGSFTRLWRKGETLLVEVARPASAEAALSDAAWDVITSIKDRAFQRELMRRSEEAGMLGALLAARHAGARDNLGKLPEAHFTVQSVVGRLSGPAARQADEYRNLLKNLLTELEEYQGIITRQLSEVLRHGLNNR